VGVDRLQSHYSCALRFWQVEKSENWIRDRMLGPSSVVYRLPSGPALAAGHLPTVLSIASSAGARILCGGLDATCGAARALGHASACHNPPTRVNNSRSRPRSLPLFVCLSPAEPCCLCSSVFRLLNPVVTSPCTYEGAVGGGMSRGQRSGRG